MGMQNPVAAMCAFAGKGELGSLAIELRAPLNQFFDALRAFLHQDFRGFRIAQTIAGNERVLQVQADFVFVAECGGDAALGILGGRVGDFSLRQDHDAASGGQFDGSPQAGDSRALSDEDEISLHLQDTLNAGDGF